MKQPITVNGFEQKFARDADPWGTFVNRSEAQKRNAIQHALGTAIAGRTLELASGNGSNSAMLARRSLRLTSCDGSPSATALTKARLALWPHAEVRCCILPEGLPRGTYDQIVAAEILYYLSPCDMRKLARKLRQALQPGGRLILAHHHVHFDDAAQPPGSVHQRFVEALPFSLKLRVRKRNSRWLIEQFVRCKS